MSPLIMNVRPGDDKPVETGFGVTGWACVFSSGETSAMPEWPEAGSFRVHVSRAKKVTVWRVFEDGYRVTLLKPDGFVAMGGPFTSQKAGREWLKQEGQR